MEARDAVKSFRPGDVVTVRRAVKSGRYPEYRLYPGDEGIVDCMGQYVFAHFHVLAGQRNSDGQPIANVQRWRLYDGNVMLLRRTDD